MADNSVKLRPPALPTNIDDWHRDIKSHPTLNDQVEEIHRNLWGKNPEYHRLLEAVWDSDAVEGSLAIDNVMAAQMIRKHAIEMGKEDITKKPLDTLVKSLGVVLRRYNASRKQRRQTVGGETVPINNGGDE